MTTISTGDRREVSEKANTIRILQSILGIPESTDAELTGKSQSELQATIETLRKQIGNRPSENDTKPDNLLARSPI